MRMHAQKGVPSGVYGSVTRGSGGSDLAFFLILLYVFLAVIALSGAVLLITSLFDALKRRWRRTRE